MPAIITPLALFIIWQEHNTLSMSNVSFPLPQNCILLLIVNSANIKLKGRTVG